jgi:tetrahydrodipicolinate N-succinyltransferase
VIYYYRIFLKAKRQKSFAFFNTRKTEHSMKQKLLILGAGQYGLVARDIALATGLFSSVDFLDDSKDCAIGTLDRFSLYAKDYVAVVAMGNAELRLEWLDKLKSTSFPIASLIHPTAIISPGAKLGEGVIVEPLCVVHNESSLGRGVILSAGSIVDHNSTIGDGAHVGCGAVVSSNSAVPPLLKVENNQTFPKNS